jgi:hypothetical protein
VALTATTRNDRDQYEPVQTCHRETVSNVRRSRLFQGRG